MKSNILKMGLIVVCGQAAAADIAGFNDLHSESEVFVRAVCGGFVQNKDAVTDDQKELFDVCGSMVHSVNAITGTGATAKDRGLENEVLAGGFQNIVPEETLAPMSIATNTSSVNLSAINSRLGKIRSGGGAGDDLFSATRLGFFISGTGGFGELDKSVEQDAADFNTQGVITGFDYKLSENLIVGLAGSYSFFDLDFDKNVDVAGGSVEADSYSVTAYSNYAFGTGGYVEGVFTYGWSDYDLNRGIVIDSNTAVEKLNLTAVADPEGEQFSISLASGYDFNAGSFSYGPYARISYFETKIDSYNESGAGGLNLHVGEHDGDSLETVLGGQLTYAQSYSWGVLVPHAKAEWHHEYKNSSRSFDVTYVNDPRSNANVYRSTTGSPDRDFANLSAGFSAQLKHGFQAFFDYQTILGLNDIETHKFSAGIRVEL